MKQTRLLTILWAMTLMLAIVTQSAWAQSTSDIGKVLAADGKMYKTVAAATKETPGKCITGTDPLIRRQKQFEANVFFIIFAPKLLSMTLQKWIEDRAIHGFPTFSIEDVRAADLCSSEQILQNELSRLSSNRTQR